jgi:hypothetical protein
MTPIKSPARDERQDNGVIFKSKQLHKAIVADVTKHTQNSRTACTIWVPKLDSTTMASEFESAELPTKKLKTEHTYQALQQYDLDAVPLRDPSGPPVQYVWMIDPSKNYAGYHCVRSRVQLSTGRPIVVSGTPHGASTAEMVTDKSFIFRRSLEEVEKKNLEMSMAVVDVDLAEKFGLVEEDEVYPKGKWGTKIGTSESESDDIA